MITKIIMDFVKGVSLACLVYQPERIKVSIILDQVDDAPTKKCALFIMVYSQ